MSIWGNLELMFRGMFEGVKEPIKTLQASTQEEQPMQQNIVYAEFEEAINQWEKRTGKKVERSFKDREVEKVGNKNVYYFSGDEWKNFAAFLGSREAADYRKKWKVNLNDLMKEMQEAQTEMRVDDEADDLDKRLREIGL